MDEILSTFEKTWNTVFESKGNGFMGIDFQFSPYRENVKLLPGIKLTVSI